MHCISPKIKAYWDDPAINGFERGFNEGNGFYIGYIHLFLDIHALQLLRLTFIVN